MILTCEQCRLRLDGPGKPSDFVMCLCPRCGGRMTGDGEASGPSCARCGGIMTPADSRLRPELFYHDRCLPDEFRPQTPPAENPMYMTCLKCNNRLPLPGDLPPAGQTKCPRCGGKMIPERAGDAGGGEEPNYPPETEPASALVPRTPSRGRLIPPDDAGDDWCLTNIDLSTEANRCLLINALAEPDIKIGETGEVELKVSAYLATSGERADRETGEIVRFPRLALISPEGKVFVTTSQYLPHRMARLLDAFGPGPWDPPLRVLIRERRSKTGMGRYHELRMLPRELPQQEDRP